MRESTIEAAVCKFARNSGLIVWKLSSPGTRGVPDRMFLGESGTGGGLCVFIEFKRPGGKLTALQEKWGRDVREKGFRWEMVDTVEDGIRILREEFRL